MNHSQVASSLCLILTLCLPTIFAPSVRAQRPEPPIRLWLGTAPGEQVSLPPEADLTKPNEGKVSGRTVIRLGNVSTPTLTVYHPKSRLNTGAAMLVCPGGGYHILAMDLEGTEICEWLQSKGITAILLKYRVPRRANLEKHIAPLQDAQRAMGLIRQKAKEWNMDPERIGIMGFSAGAHLAAVTSAQYTTRSYPAVDAADQFSSKPSFTALIYPAYLTDKDKGDVVSPELVITDKTAPTFIAITQDDPVRIENAVHYALALKNVKVPVEMHWYPSGGHGYGLRPSRHGVSHWPDHLHAWMQTQGWLTRSKR